MHTARFPLTRKITERSTPNFAAGESAVPCSLRALGKSKARSEADSRYTGVGLYKNVRLKDIEQAKSPVQYLQADISTVGWGLDHGVGHSLLLLYDVNVPNSQNSKEVNGLGHYPSNISLSMF